MPTHMHGVPNRSRRRITREVLSLLTLVVSVGVAADAMHQHGRALDEINMIKASALRAQTQDRLIGQRVDLQALSESNPEPWPTGLPSVLWVVDLEDCVGCFDSVRAWSELEGLQDHHLAIIFVGETTPAVDARLRTLPGTSVGWIDRETVERVVGSLLPNTKMLLDQEGIVVLADSRFSGQECGWSFEAQVGALTGLAGADQIRRDVESLT